MPGRLSGFLTGGLSIPKWAVERPMGPSSGPGAGPHGSPARRYNRFPMFKSLVRTLRGPSNDPRMAYISRPLPRDLHDEDVLAALDVALARDPDPAYLVETLPAALREVTGVDYEVLDRSTRDVTATFVKSMVMIRRGGVGLWPGYAARAYPMLARDADHEETRAAIAAAEGAEVPQPKAGWEPPTPRRAAGAAQASGSSGRDGGET